MGIGLGVVLLLIGLILAFGAISLPASIDDAVASETLGWIFIVVGVLAIVLALVGAVVGEFVGGRQGLGASIIAAQSVMDSSLIVALFVVITALGMAVYEAARGLEALILRRYARG